jgi:hypothetical protein
MYCPRCGQQLASEIRFCSSCGLPMHVVADIIVNDGMLPACQAPGSIENESSPHRGTRLGAKLIFLSVVLLPLCVALSYRTDSPAPLFVPLTVFLVGSFWLIYSRLFAEEPLVLNQQNRPTQRALANERVAALPPQKKTVDGFIPRAVDTGEFAEPPGVTDHTTRLLD